MAEKIRSYAELRALIRAVAPGSASRMGPPMASRQFVISTTLD